MLIAGGPAGPANGLVGTTTGVTFLVTSVISGLLVAAGGMFYVLLLAMGVLVAAVVHLGFVAVDGSADAPGDRQPADGSGG